MTTRLNNPPVFLLAFANDRNDRAQYLRNLPAELREIKTALDQARTEGLCDYVYLANATLTEILDTFTKNEYRNRIAGFHYGGHANDFQLMLETNDGRVATADAAGLATFLSRQLGLQLVFLNGCSTQRQVEALLDANIPMVIATSQAIKDDVAKEFASRFYRGLAGGISVQAAYREAEAAARAQGNGNVRNLFWAGAQPALEQIQEDRWPWDLYFKKGAEATGEWNLPEAVGNPLFGIPQVEPGDLPAEPFRHLSWFTRKDAEVFFGRNHEIRQLYDRITEPAGAPIVLLYGQTGVGKSSLLDAGLTPRMEHTHQVLYLRRNQELGLLGTLAQALNFTKDDPAKLGSVWRTLEQHVGKPTLLILDQIEEVFTRPGDTEVELEEFLQALVETFAIPAQRPQGRLILGFRKEWESEIEQKLKANKLAHAKVFLDRLNRRNIIQAVVGVTSSPRLQRQYNISIEDGLPEVIADDLSSDPNSPIAPTLQILLTKLWTEARKRNSAAPRFDLELYLRLHKEGILLGDFLDQQITQLQESQPHEVNSGLVLDALAFHTTPLGTAEQRTETQIQQEYKHIPEVLPLLEKLKALYLLADPPQDRSDKTVNKTTRLAHDTLGPLIRAKFSNSVLPGQRARRILENRSIEWVGNKTGTPLDKRDLTSVEKGLSGMRALLPEEDQLINASRRARDRAERTLKLIKVVAVVALIAVISSAAVAWWLRGQAETARQEALSRQLATQANSLGSGPARLHTQRVLLGIEALRRSESADSYAALHEPLGLLPTLKATRMSPQASVPNPNPNKSLRQIVRFSPDNKTVAIGRGNNVSLWDFTTNREVGRFDDEQQINLIRFTDNGRYLISGSGKLDTFRPERGAPLEIRSTKGTVIVWDCRELREVTRKEFPTTIRQVGFLKDERLLVVSDLWTATTTTLDGNQDRLSWQIVDDNKRLIQTALSEDSRYLAVGTLPAVKIFDMLSGQMVSSLQVEMPQDGKGFISEVAFSPDATRLLTNTMKLGELWDWEARSRISKIELASARGELRLSPDNQLIVGLGDEDQFLTWESDTGKRLASVPKTEQFGSYYSRILFAPGSQSIAVSAGDRAVRIFHPGTEKEFSRIATGSNISDIAYSADGQYLATADEEGQVAVWQIRGIFDTETFSAINAVYYDPKSQYSLRRGDNSLSLIRLNDNSEVTSVPGVTSEPFFSENGERFALVRRINETQRVVEVIELSSGRIVSSTEVSSLDGFALSPDGTRLLFAVNGEPLKEIEVENHNVITHPGLVGNRVRISKDGRYFLLQYQLEESEVKKPESPLEVFDVATKQKIATIPTTEEDPEVAFSSNNNYLAAIIDDSTLVIWDLQKQVQMHRLATADTAHNLVFSPNNKYLGATVGPSALVWEVSTGKPLELKHESGATETVAFSNDSGLVVTTHAAGSIDSGANRVEIWKLPTGEKTAAITIPGAVSNALFSPNDEKLVLVREWVIDSDISYTRFLPWKPRDLIAQACRRLPRNFTRQEWKQYLGNEPYRPTCENLPPET